MDEDRTFLCATISETIVNNKTIVISTKAENKNEICKSVRSEGGFHSESFDELPPPVNCSTPKASSLKPRTQTKLCSPTSTWLSELKDCVHPECTASLQSKSLIVDTHEKVKLLSQLTTKVVQTLHHQTFTVAKEFDHIYRCLEMNCTKHISNLVDDLVSHMAVILVQHSDEHCDLSLYNNFGTHTDDYLPHLVYKLNLLALDFSKRIDRLLLRQIEVFISVMSSVSDQPSAVMTVLKSLANVGLQCDHLGSLLSRCNGITVLLSIGQTSAHHAVRLLALKMISAVLCSPSAITNFSEVEGVTKLCQVITNESSQRIEKKQALTIMAQVSHPRAKIHAKKDTSVKIIEAVTESIKTNACPDSLLLAALSLTNLSVDRENVKFLVKHSTVTHLLNAIKNQGNDGDVFVKEQAASIIANMSESNDTIKYLCQNRVIPALLCFLNFESLEVETTTDSPSYQLQYKCALALARLCSEKEAVSQLEKLKAVPKLWKLCKLRDVIGKKDQRMDACLEVLRSIFNQPEYLKKHTLKQGTMQRITSILSH